MTTGSIIWLVIAAMAAVLYFGIAAVVSVRGLKDLRRLLGRSGEEKKSN